MSASRCWVIGLLLLALPSMAAADHHEGLMKEVEEIGDALAQALIDDDLEAMLAYYTEDAISLPNFEPRMEGKAAFRAHYEQMKTSGMKITSFTSQPTDVWAAGDQVIEIGTFEIALEMPGAPGPIQDVGKYVTIYERDAEGALKIKVETWNTDTNPMEMGGGHHHGDEHGHGHSGHGHGG